MSCNPNNFMIKFAMNTVIICLVIFSCHKVYARYLTREESLWTYLSPYSDIWCIMIYLYYHNASFTQSHKSGDLYVRFDALWYIIVIITLHPGLRTHFVKYGNMDHQKDNRSGTRVPLFSMYSKTCQHGSPFTPHIEVWGHLI